MNRCLFIVPWALLAGCARFESRPIAPAETADRFEQRTLENQALKTFLETNLHRELTDRPARSWNFEMLALAAFYYQPGLEVARAQCRVSHRSPRSTCRMSAPLT